MLNQLSLGKSWHISKKLIKIRIIIRKDTRLSAYNVHFNGKRNESTRLFSNCFENDKNIPDMGRKEIYWKNI